MLRLRATVLFRSAVAVAAIGCVSLQGSEPWNGEPFAATAAEILTAVKAVPEPVDTDMESMLEEHVLRFNDDGTHVSRYRHVYRVLTDNAIDFWGSVEAQWSPWRQQRPSIEARVIGADGQIRRLMPHEIVEAPVEQQSLVYSDSRQLQAPLPGVEAGAVVEVLVTTVATKPFFAAGTVHSYYLARFQPTRQIRIIADTPSGMPFQHAVEGDGIQASITEANGRKRRVWELTSVPILSRIEFDTPGNIVPGASVSFSTGSSWKAVAESYAKIIDEQLQDRSFAGFAKGLIGAERDQRKVIAQLLQYVQSQIRYTGLEFGEAGIVPALPAEVLRRRYGDCKDQAVVLVGLLREVGIPAHVALLRGSRSNHDVNPTLPGLGRFNHAIVFIPGDEPLWIDPTDRYLPAGELPLADQDRWALIARRGEEKLIRTPKSTSSDNGYVETQDWYLEETGKVRVTETTVYRGSLARAMREQILSNSARDWRQSLRQYVERQYGSTKVTAMEWSDPRAVDQPLVIRLEAADATHADCSIAEAVAHVLPATILSRLPPVLLDFREYATDSEATSTAAFFGDESPTQLPRKHPLAMRELHQAEMVCRLHLPRGYEVRDLPADAKVQIGLLTFAHHCRDEGNGIVTATFRLDTGNGILSPDEIKACQEAFNKYASNGSIAEWLVTLRGEHVGVEHENAGRLKEAFAIYTRELAENPGGVPHHVRLVEAYVNAGFPDAARALARKLDAIAPHDPMTQSALAYAHSRDDHTTNTCSGQNREIALATFRKALESERKQDFGTWRQNLGIILEYDAFGQRYPVQGLEKAVEQYQALGEDLAPEYRAALRLVLLHLGRWKELEAEIDDPGADAELQAMLIAAIAKNRGIEDALRWVRSTLSAEQRQLALFRTSDVLNVAREYPLAAAMLDAGLTDDHPQRGNLLGVRDTRLSTQRYDQVQLPADDPRHVVQQLMMNAFASQEFAAANAELIDAPAAHREAIVAGMDKFVRDLRQAFVDGNHSVGRRVDSISLAKFAKTGSDSVGYRVKLTFLNSTSHWYVVRREAGYRIIANDDTMDGLASECLRRLDSGELDGAKACLEWIWRAHAGELELFNSLSGPPMLRIWNPSNDPQADQLRVAATAWLVEGDAEGRWLDDLEQARPQAEKNVQIHIDRALAEGYSVRQEFEKALAAIERVLSHHPQSRDYSWMKFQTLLELNRLSDAQAWADQALGASKDSASGKIALYLVAEAVGDVEKGVRITRELADNTELATHFNSAAWSALFLETPDERALQDALKAAELRQYEDPKVLHTLAAATAEFANPHDALRYLKMAADHRIPTGIQADDWYVIGRIAERYGLSDVAEFYYQRVPPQKRRFSSYALAQRRLKQLQGASPAKEPAGDHMQVDPGD